MMKFSAAGWLVSPEAIAAIESPMTSDKISPTTCPGSARSPKPPPLSRSSFALTALILAISIPLFNNSVLITCTTFKGSGCLASTVARSMWRLAAAARTICAEIADGGSDNNCWSDCHDRGAATKADAPPEIQARTSVRFG